MPDYRHHGDLEIIGDESKVKRYSLKCKNDHKWFVDVPGELVDSGVAMRFQCPQCGLHYILIKNRFIREDVINDRPEGQTSDKQTKYGYDT